jgi:ribonucleoside-diphosphate reductase alpha chain
LLQLCRNSSIKQFLETGRIIQKNYADNEVPVSVMAQDMLTCFKLGHKTAYYQNTYDIKTDEVVDDQKQELKSLLNDIMKSDEEACESCTI